eukprot:scaffold895_cov315-Pinguiococcus_pyrenoidosus.AAC.45
MVSAKLSPFFALLVFELTVITFPPSFIIAACAPTSHPLSLHQRSTHALPLRPEMSNSCACSPRRKQPPGSFLQRYPPLLSANVCARQLELASTTFQRFARASTALHQRFALVCHVQNQADA